MDAHIKEKHAQADIDKKKTLQAYDRLAADRACGGKSYTTVSTEKTVGKSVFISDRSNFPIYVYMYIS